MASAELSRRVERLVGYPPLCEKGSELAATPAAATSYGLLVVDDHREGGHGYQFDEMRVRRLNRDFLRPDVLHSGKLSRP